jgi:AcrR family transcriptional regulator
MANDKRLYDIFEAASRLFILKGYNETQIVDIAKAASISTGALYNLFTSKKAVFHFTSAKTLRFQ